jgi:hypothetical protein
MHYDVLGGLKVLAEADLIDDPWCSAALDVLATKIVAVGKEWTVATARSKNTLRIMSFGGSAGGE